MKINVASITDIGKCRSENQDCLIIDKDTHLYCVSDGMGGLAYGKVTAEIVKNQMIAKFQLMKQSNIEVNCESVEKIIKSISHHIQTMGNVYNGETLYGATLTGIILKEDKTILMNVGDSRVYRLFNHELTQCTKDQSLIQYWIDKGTLSEEKAKTHPMRNAILEFMGKAPQVKPSVQEINCFNHEMYCICSDGLFSMVDESKIQDILENNQTLEDKCQQLVEEANLAGGKDNITIILVELEKE